MAYSGWTPDHRSLLYHCWYNTIELVKFLTDSRRRNFNVELDRHTILAEYEALEKRPPFSLHQRFPKDCSYIYACQPQWKFPLDSIHAALESIKNGGRSSKDSPDVLATAKEYDHVLLFWECNSMLLQTIYVNGNEGMIHREIFEKGSGLVWENCVVN